MTHHIDTAIGSLLTVASAAAGWVGAKSAAFIVADANGYSLNDIGQAITGTGGAVVLGIIVFRMLLKDRQHIQDKLEKLEEVRQDMAEKMLQAVMNSTSAIEQSTEALRDNGVKYQQIVSSMNSMASAVNNAIGEIRKK